MIPMSLTLNSKNEQAHLDVTDKLVNHNLYTVILWTIYNVYLETKDDYMLHIFTHGKFNLSMLSTGSNLVMF